MMSGAVLIVFALLFRDEAGGPVEVEPAPADIGDALSPP